MVIGRRPNSDRRGEPAGALLIAAPSCADLAASIDGEGWRIVAAVPSAGAALHAAAAECPDLALVDVVLHGEPDGIALADELHRRHSVPVLFVSAPCDAETSRRAVATHPLGWVLRPFARAQLRVAVELALRQASTDRGHRPEPGGERSRIRELEDQVAQLEAQIREIAGLVSEQGAEPAAADPSLERRLSALSPREIEIVRLLSEGCRVAVMARDLDLSVHTVRNHLRAIFRKVQVHSQEELLDAVRGLPRLLSPHR